MAFEQLFESVVLPGGGEQAELLAIGHDLIAGCGAAYGAVSVDVVRCTSGCGLLGSNISWNADAYPASTLIGC